MSNQRNSPRFPVNLDVDFYINHNLHTGLLLTASPFGVFLKTNEQLSVNQIIKIILPLTHINLQVIGRIAWVANKIPYGAGVEFQNLNQEEQDVILNTIKSGLWLSGCLGNKNNIFSTDSQEIIADLDC